MHVRIVFLTVCGAGSWYFELRLCHISSSVEPKVVPERLFCSSVEPKVAPERLFGSSGRAEVVVVRKFSGASRLVLAKVRCLPARVCATPVLAG